jgi:hypothetical protein
MIAVLAAFALSAQSPRQFIEQLYANYRHSDFSPLAHPERVFARRLAAAIAEDQRLAHGEVGYLDGDPLCDCQDSGGLHARIRDVRADGKGTTVEVLVDSGSKADRRDLKIKLVSTKAGWRIADIGSPSEPSLLRALDASNRNARRH